MPDYSLVPVDHQPDFDDYSLVPVDHDPFGAGDLAQQPRIQQAQAQVPAQQLPAVEDGRPNVGTLTRDGVLEPLKDENHMVDSYVYKKLAKGTPPTGPQVSTADGSKTITATGGANHTNSGGVYGHRLTLSESASKDLGTITAADPDGLLVATPVEGDPDRLVFREYKGY